MYLGTQISLTGLVLTIAILAGIAIYQAIDEKRRPSVFVMAIVLFSLFAAMVAVPAGAIVRIWQAASLW